MRVLYKGTEYSNGPRTTNPPGSFQMGRVSGLLSRRSNCSLRLIRLHHQALGCSNGPETTNPPGLFRLDQLSGCLKFPQAGSSTLLEDDWISFQSQMLLWIPIEYRSFFRWAQHGGALVLAYTNGRVLFLGSMQNNTNPRFILFFFCPFFSVITLICHIKNTKKTGKGERGDWK